MFKDKDGNNDMSPNLFFMIVIGLGVLVFFGIVVF